MVIIVVKLEINFSPVFSHFHKCNHRKSNCVMYRRNSIILIKSNYLNFGVYITQFL